ncbi:unnamed protein product [Rotaria magnacalcarata]|uniref:HTH CENPB-type domain-containing protein n=1 Tax=Rotaria magnacalcarata TaxID=392030 RepID=A0A8S2JG10_9BILA|nr:unnamed protein product [Rotaria magnacalcarata]CAF3812888.1 unnamed protein product [Rotaria magnacalcarata]CAF3822607.1 unnamed protein product [Rotaria magnacalcarata]
MEAITSGRSIRDASNSFLVPYTTLNSHVNNEVLYGQVGRPIKFSMEEEVYLEQTVVALQSWGVLLSIEEFLHISEEYASSLNKSHLFPAGKPTYDWLRSFLKRHTNLILKKSYPLEKKRAVLTSEQIEEWFGLLSKVIEENDLANCPAQLFNCDETDLSDSISYSKVLVHRRTSNAYRIQGGSGGKSFASVMFCASATDFLLPPFVVYKSERLYQEWCSGGPPEACFYNSENTTASSRPGFSSFGSSRNAITTLDQVLEDTISNNSSHNADDDTDEDEDYIDDVVSKLSLEVSQESIEVVKQPPAKNSCRVKQPTSILSRKNSKNAQTKQSQQSLKAITHTLQAVFAPSLQQTALKPTKRTMLKRSSGQIMTEEDVIKQLEEKRKQKISKQSRSTTGRFNGAKRRKSETHDSSIVSPTNKAMLLRSSSSSIDPIQSSITIVQAPSVSHDGI